MTRLPLRTTLLRHPTALPLCRHPFPTTPQRAFTKPSTSSSPPPPGFLWYARLALLFAAHGALWTSLGTLAVERTLPFVRALAPAPPLPSPDTSPFSALASTSRTVQALRADPRYEEIEYRGKAGLTTGLLKGNGLVQFRRVWACKEDASTVSVVGLGRKLCGFPGTVMMDEALGQSAILVLPPRTAFTAHLSLSYKHPTIAQRPAEQSPSSDEFVVIRAWVVEHTGRKATVKGTLEDGRGRTLVEADAVFVVPRERAVEGM